MNSHWILRTASPCWIAMVTVLLFTCACHGHPVGTNHVFYLQKRESLLLHYERRILEDSLLEAVQRGLREWPVLGQPGRIASALKGALGLLRKQPEADAKYTEAPPPMRDLDIAALRGAFFRPPARPDAGRNDEIDTIALNAVNAQWNDIVEILASDLPYMPTDPADPRAIEVIKPSAPVSVIISKVFVADNGRWRIHDVFGLPTLAVVLEVADGETSPKRAVVAVVREVGDGVALPIGDILAYHTERYAGQPLMFKIRLVSIADYNEQLIDLISTAAALAQRAAGVPDSVMHVARQVGEFLAGEEEHTILTFAFQLYPGDETSPGGPLRSSLIPYLRAGAYAVFSSSQPRPLLGPGEALSFDWDFTAYTHPDRNVDVSKSSPWLSSVSLHSDVRRVDQPRLQIEILDALRIGDRFHALWPVDREGYAAARDSRASQSTHSYIILKVASLNLSRAASIIEDNARDSERAFEAAREAARLRR